MCLMFLLISLRYSYALEIVYALLIHESKSSISHNLFSIGKEGSDIIKQKYSSALNQEQHVF